MSTYVIELGLDFNAIPVASGWQKGLYYLPAGITENGAASTYTKLKSKTPTGGDEIEVLIFDISSLSSDVVDPLPTFTNLHFSFRKARHQPNQSPFDDHNAPISASILPTTEVTSVLFGSGLSTYEVTFRNQKTSLDIANKGFFTSSYLLQVDFEGETRTYVHDPEWIVDPF